MLAGDSVALGLDIDHHQGRRGVGTRGACRRKKILLLSLNFDWLRNCLGRDRPCIRGRTERGAPRRHFTAHSSARRFLEADLKQALSDRSIDARIETRPAGPIVPSGRDVAPKGAPTHRGAGESLRDEACSPPGHSESVNAEDRRETPPTSLLQSVDLIRKATRVVRPDRLISQWSTP
jgi:hypothetical protein